MFVSIVEATARPAGSVGRAALPGDVKILDANDIVLALPNPKGRAAACHRDF